MPKFAKSLIFKSANKFGFKSLFSFLISIRILKLLLSGLIKFPTWVILAFILFPSDGKNNSTLVSTLIFFK